MNLRQPEVDEMLTSQEEERKKGGEEREGRREEDLFFLNKVLNGRDNNLIK